MKARNLLPLALAASTLAACAGTVEDGIEDAPLDAEHGLETLDGRDDSFAIRPGSPEAEAVVAFVNRDIADDAAGVVFQDELDVKLHAWAARNIAEFRAGEDGTFGTPDDQRFDDLSQLDGVSWVGRTALMRLFELAEDAGFFQRPTVDCADYVDHDRWNNYYINSYADLLEYENSRCSSITGNVYLQISGTDLLPPAARAVRNLRYLKSIDGQLHITTSTHFNSVHFEALETVTGDIRAESPIGRQHTLEFTNLTSAKSIHMSKIGSSQFPALEHNDRIELRDTDLEGFTALEASPYISISQREHGTWNVSFPALTAAGQLRFEVHRANSWTTPDVTFTGGFPKLKAVEYLSMNNGKYAQMTFPDMDQVETLNTNQAVDPHVGMSELITVDSFTSNMDEVTAGVHSGPESLRDVGALTVTTALHVEGYDALQSADRNISITTQLGVEGFNDLTTANGAINLRIGGARTQTNLTGFNKLEMVGSISINGNNAPVEIGALFEDLEFTDGPISITTNYTFDTNPVFESLMGMGGTLRVDQLHEGVDMMPELVLVDGSITINRTAEELIGFPKLEQIEGSLTLKRSMNQLTGMQDLTAIGGNLSVPRTFAQPDLDDFLNRLEEFSGTINYN